MMALIDCYANLELNEEKVEKQGQFMISVFKDTIPAGMYACIIEFFLDAIFQLSFFFFSFSLLV